MSRPQSGINRADIIYETRVEGGETRCNVLWHSDIPDDVGNVRSARLSDLWIVPQYNGLFMYAGGNDEYYAGVPLYIAQDMSYHIAVDLYYRTKDRVAPHNLYLALGDAYKAAKALGYPTTTDHVKGLYFGDPATNGSESTPVAAVTTSDDAVSATDPAAADPALNGKSITITYANYSAAHWDWDPARQVYLRTQGGKIHKDAETGEQVFTTNVVLIFAQYAQRPALDPAGSPTWDINLGGSGKAIICKDGQAIEGTWKADRNTPPVFIGADGQQIPLNPGRTWVEVPAQDTPVTVE
jgi:hypothetical protein